MATQDDLLAAKAELAARVLPARTRRRTAEIAAAHTVEVARRNAGRNIHGVGVAYKIVRGRRTSALCVRVHVVQKLPMSMLPRAARLPPAVDGVPTDVVEVPPASFHATARSAQRQRPQRPMIGGISAAHFLVNMATLGCFCTRRRRAGVYMLSCNHAFANVNGRTGAAVYQPSPGHGGVAADRVGRHALCVKLHLDGSTANEVDAAIALVDPPMPVRKEVCSIGRLRGVGDALEGMRVRKYGCRTGYTEGVVEMVAYDMVVPYAGSWAWFEDQIFVTPTRGYPAFALGGDSGSVVVALNSPRAVGLHFAGPADGSYSVASHMKIVCKRLGISIP